ncbi:MAG: YraN family protein [Xanthomonadales bacterium]|nr:YraN family protein [Xanthomonadales bacterium]
MKSRLERGADWEQSAEAFLAERGLHLLQRNYRTRRGEIDLVMRDGETLVFVEVRYRGAGSRGSGAESVTPAKQRRITEAARHFLSRADPHTLHPCRFDVVAIGQERGRTVMNWIRGAFEAA